MFVTEKIDLGGVSLHKNTQNWHFIIHTAKTAINLTFMKSTLIDINVVDKIQEHDALQFNSIKNCSLQNDQKDKLNQQFVCMCLGAAGL